MHPLVSELVEEMHPLVEELAEEMYTLVSELAEEMYPLVSELAEEVYSKGVAWAFEFGSGCGLASGWVGELVCLIRAAAGSGSG